MVSVFYYSSCIQCILLCHCLVHMVCLLKKNSCVWIGLRKGMAGHVCCFMCGLQMSGEINIAKRILQPNYLYHYCESYISGREGTWILRNVYTGETVVHDDCVKMITDERKNGSQLQHLFWQNFNDRVKQIEQTDLLSEYSNHNWCILHYVVYWLSMWVKTC